MTQIPTFKAVHSPVVPSKVVSIQKFGSDETVEAPPAEVVAPESSGSNPLSGALCGAAAYYLVGKVTESRFLQIGAAVVGYLVGSSVLTLDNLKSILPAKKGDAEPVEAPSEPPAASVEPPVS